MPLAAIIGLYALLTVPSTDGTFVSASAVLLQDTQPENKPQGQPDPETEQEPAQEPSKPDVELKPAEEGKPAQAPVLQQEPETSETDTTKEIKCESSSKKNSGKHKTVKAPRTGANKRVVRNGSTTDPTVQISPSVTEQEASQQRQNINQLLASTDANLQKIAGKQLNPNQQGMVNQIRKYMEQAKTADTAGDLQRAQNLAFKAHLLSDELLRR